VPYLRGDTSAAGSLDPDSFLHREILAHNSIADSAADRRILCFNKPNNINSSFKQHPNPKIGWAYIGLPGESLKAPFCSLVEHLFCPLLLPS